MATDGLEQSCTAFLDELRARHGLRSASVRARASDLRLLCIWLRAHGVDDPAGITRATLRAWLAGLHDDAYSRSSMARMLSTARSFLRYQARQGQTIDQRALSLSAGRERRDLPRVLIEGQATVLPPTGMAADRPLPWPARSRNATRRPWSCCTGPGSEPPSCARSAWQIWIDITCVYMFRARADASGWRCSGSRLRPPWTATWGRAGPPC